MPSVSAPPGRLSTTMVAPPSAVASSAASSRAITSVALPGACGTISRIGLSGNSAAAGAGSATAAHTLSNKPRSERAAAIARHFGFPCAFPQIDCRADRAAEISFQHSPGVTKRTSPGGAPLV